MTIRDRITAFLRVPARDLIPHERNWRQHPPEQVAALEGVLAEIGYADALLVRRGDDGSLIIIDGHLRAASTPDQLVPVLVLDVTAEEADKILLTHDPLSLLATANRPLLAELMAETHFENPAVRSLLAGLDRHFADENSGEETLSETGEVRIEQSYQVAVECRDEAEQAELFERLRSEGYRCRLLVM